MQVALSEFAFRSCFGSCFEGCGQCRLAKERDLEGIDVSNIVSGARRARRSAAVAAPIDYAAIDKPSSSDEDDDSANEQTSSSEDGSDVVRGKGTSLIVHLLQPQAG